ncbi:hypothetical protein [Bacillus sp. LL01]|uniref:hypothetical protein n=1 Tax=Bacillus sp. LL01 TaxID=1665556 RepID=UPI0018E3186D|nr:hypothetical protein [Bacillus sp. LL01]
MGRKNANVKWPIDHKRIAVGSVVAGVSFVARMVNGKYSSTVGSVIIIARKYCLLFLTMWKCSTIKANKIPIRMAIIRWKQNSVSSENLISLKPGIKSTFNKSTYIFFSRKGFKCLDEQPHYNPT